MCDRARVLSSARLRVARVTYVCSALTRVGMRRLLLRRVRERGCQLWRDRERHLLQGRLEGQEYGHPADPRRYVSLPLSAALALRRRSRPPRKRACAFDPRLRAPPPRPCAPRTALVYIYIGACSTAMPKSDCGQYRLESSVCARTHAHARARAHVVVAVRARCAGASAP